MSSSVYLSHTPDWTTHYLRFPIFTGKRFSVITVLLYSSSSMALPLNSTPLTSTSEIVVWFHGEGYSTSHESHACGLPGVRFPRAVITNLNCSPRKNSRGERRIPQRFAHSYLLHT